MNNTLIIYDNNGVIFFQASGDIQSPVGLQHLLIEVPLGSHVTSIDTSVTPHVAVFETPPKDQTLVRLETVEALLEEMIMGGM